MRTYEIFNNYYCSLLVANNWQINKENDLATRNQFSCFLKPSSPNNDYCQWHLVENGRLISYYNNINKLIEAVNLNEGVDMNEIDAGYHNFMKKAYPVECTDGYKVSIQAHECAYCSPRDNEGPWDQFELGFPSAYDEIIMPYCEDPKRPTDTVYAYVPTLTIWRLLEAHGGPTQANWVGDDRPEVAHFSPQEKVGLLSHRINILAQLGYQLNYTKGVEMQKPTSPDLIEQTLLDLEETYRTKVNELDNYMANLGREIEGLEDFILSKRKKLNDLAELQAQAEDNKIACKQLLTHYKRKILGEVPV